MPDGMKQSVRPGSNSCLTILFVEKRTAILASVIAVSHLMPG